MEEELTHSSSADITELFNEHFPYYLACGMTYDQFWRDDPGLVRAYRKARKIKRDWINEEAWLQGLYFYEALCDVSPLLHAFARSGTKPSQYPSEPYPLTDTEKEQKKAQEEKLQQEQYKDYIARFAKSFNEKFRKEGN